MYLRQVYNRPYFIRSSAWKVNSAKFITSPGPLRAAQEGVQRPFCLDCAA